MTQKQRVSDLGAVEFDEYVAKRYIQTLNRAREKGYEFDLTLSDIRNLLRRKTCFYTKVVMVMPLYADKNTKQYPDALTFDRVDPNKGYIKSNVVACSFKSNHLKSTLEGRSEFDLMVLNKVMSVLDEVGFKGINLE